MRAVVVSDPEQLNTGYRGFQPVQALASAGHEARLHPVREVDLRLADLTGADVAYVYRYQGRATRRVLEQARATGAAVVWDNDDDFTAFPSDDVEVRRKGALRSQHLLALTGAMLRLSDVTTTTTDELAESFRRNGATCVRVVENFVGTEFDDVPRTPHAGVVIGWVAATEHRHDLRALGLRDTLQRLLDAHADVRVVSVGIDLGLRSDRYEPRGFVAFHELPAAMSDFDIGLAPIADVPFNQARSNIKVKEYAALGIPWLASPIGPYAPLGEKQGGRLVPDHAWYDALDDLIRNTRTRRKLAKRATRWAKDQHIHNNARHWTDAFEEAVQRRRRAAEATSPASA